jgi:hypothetical protein
MRKEARSNPAAPWGRGEPPAVPEEADRLMVSGGRELMLLVEARDCSGHSLSRQLRTEVSFLVSVMIRLKSSYFSA